MSSGIARRRLLYFPRSGGQTRIALGQPQLPCSDSLPTYVYGWRLCYSGLFNGGSVMEPESKDPQVPVVRYEVNGRRHPLNPVCLLVLACVCVLGGVILEVQGRHAPMWLGGVAGTAIGAVLAWLTPAG